MTVKFYIYQKIVKGKVVKLIHICYMYKCWVAQYNMQDSDLLTVHAVVTSIVILFSIELFIIINDPLLLGSTLSIPQPSLFARELRSQKEHVQTC